MDVSANFLKIAYLLMEYALHVTFLNFVVYSIWIASILFAYFVKENISLIFNNSFYVLWLENVHH